MTKGQKKFTYGLFYLIVFGLIIWAAWPASSGPAAPPVDTVKSLPILVSGVPQIFKSEGTNRVVVLGQATNPNLDYGARVFSYEFIIFDRDGKTIASIPGSDSISPFETKYVLGVYDAGAADLSSISNRPGFTVSDEADFRPAGEFSESRLEFISGPLAEIGESGVKISGVIKNQGSSLAGEVKAIAILANRFGDPVFAAETVIRKLGGFEETNFEMTIPADKAVLENMDGQKTKVFIYGEK